MNIHKRQFFNVFCACIYLYKADDTSDSITPLNIFIKNVFYKMILQGIKPHVVNHVYSSYDQRDPCGEGEQLQVPRCKHLRGPDLDYTHSNTGQESQTKTVPSATAEEIQGLTSYPENFLFRGHRKRTDSVHLSVV